MTTLHSLQLRTLTGFHFTHEWKQRYFYSQCVPKSGFQFSLITLNVHNPHFLITLCVTIRNEHDALFD